MKLLKKSLLILILVLALFVFKGNVAAQTTTLTPTSVATGSATVTPTKITSLPKTGIVQYSQVFFVVSVGIILFALVF